jgi:hypothetical protein
MITIGSYVIPFATAPPTYDFNLSDTAFARSAGFIESKHPCVVARARRNGGANVSQIALLMRGLDRGQLFDTL